MKDLNTIAFISLFKEVCEKCFGYPLTAPLSETDSKLLSNTLFDSTGLVVGVKSIKNYSFYVLQIKEAKKENPSIATLDTLARYVLGAPFTNEGERKKNEDHHPYWFQYKSRFAATPSKSPVIIVNWRKTAVVFSIVLLITIGIFMTKSFIRKNRNKDFIEDFTSVAEDSLKTNDWFIKKSDTTWWNKRAMVPGHLSLFTLKGDNWPNAENTAGIKNLLVRNISSDCFAVEIHLNDFFPTQNWQQAGILISEDSTFSDKAIRLSISYNNYFGGYEKSPEIIIQAMSSSEAGNRSKPEEIAHVSLFNIEPGDEALVKKNLSRTALKIEKKGSHFRFLYSASPIESFAFREVISRDFTMHPRYIALFAIQGFSENETAMPVHFDSFNVSGIPCEN